MEKKWWLVVNYFPLDLWDLSSREVQLVLLQNFLFSCFTAEEHECSCWIMRHHSADICRAGDKSVHPQLREIRKQHCWVTFFSFLFLLSLVWLVKLPSVLLSSTRPPPLLLFVLVCLFCHMPSTILFLVRSSFVLFVKFRGTVLELCSHEKEMLFIVV